MKRRLFTIVSAVSLLLCGAILALGTRSYWRLDVIGHYSMTRTATRVWQIASSRGQLSLNWGEMSGSAEDRPSYWPCVSRPLGPTSSAWASPWHQLFEYQTTVNGTHVIRYVAVHDLWFIAATLVFPMCYGSAWLKRRRRSKAGLCPTCGYDLRASKERCPECGTPV